MEHKTMDANDLGNIRVEGMLPPPSITVVDNIDVLLSPYASKMSKTRLSRMKRSFRAQVTEWFLHYVDLYFPDDTHHLISSYVQNFREGLAMDKIIIASDVYYAGEVEEYYPNVPHPCKEFIKRENERKEEINGLKDDIDSGKTEVTANIFGSERMIELKTLLEKAEMPGSTKPTAKRHAAAEAAAEIKVLIPQFLENISFFA